MKAYMGVAIVKTAVTPGFEFNAVAPAGKVFSSTGTHSIVAFDDESKSDALRRIREDIADGFDACVMAGCEICSEAQS